MSIDSNNKTLGLMFSYIPYFLFCYSSNSFLLYFTDITLHNGLRFKKQNKTKRKKTCIWSLIVYTTSSFCGILPEWTAYGRGEAVVALMSTMPRKEWGNQGKRGCHL